MKYITTFTIIIFLISGTLKAQFIEKNFDDQIVDIYDPQEPFFHRYQTKSHICDLSENKGCNIENAFKFFLTDSRYVAPSYNSHTVVDGSIELVKLNIPGINIPGYHPIKVKVSTSNHFIINYTLSGHLLHPGMVQRKIVEENGSLVLLTVGTGKSDIGQLFKPYAGNCEEWARLIKPLSNISSITPFKEAKSFLVRTLNEIMADMNKTQCIVNDVWFPVDNFYISSFRATFKNDPPTEKPVDGTLELTGGVTPEELGKLIFKAIKTNNAQLFNSCIHPHPRDDNREKIKLDLARIREEFEENGINDWKLATFSRVHFEINPVFGEKDGGVRNGEQVRRDFTIEFTYNNKEFLGKIEGATIVTHKQKYFIWNGGFSTGTLRM